MNHQPNVNTWKCHNPQRRVLGEFFCRRREKHPSLLQNKHYRGCDWSSSHQGRQALRGPDPGEEMEAGRMLLLREVQPFSQVFSKHTMMPMSESNYLAIKDKDVTWEDANTTQRLNEQRRAAAPYLTVAG